MRPGPLALPFALVVLGALPHAAHAGPALDDDQQKPAAGATPAAPAANSPDEPPEPEVPIEYGVGFRVRTVFLPKPILDLFLARAPAGSSNVGIGGELTRRRGNTELQLGFEYEHVQPAEGVWINKGDNVAAGDEPDYIVSPAEAGGKNFGWFTVELTFFSHAKITDWLYFRYGAGLGLGILTGQVEHYNVSCAPGATNQNVEPYCVPMVYQGTATYTDPQPGVAVQVPYDLPAVFPVLNAIVGLQVRPTDKITVNLEGGIRTLPFIGLDGSYFF